MPNRSECSEVGVNVHGVCKFKGVYSYLGYANSNGFTATWSMQI